MALAAYACRWLWLKSPYGRMACVVGIAVVGYQAWNAVFPPSSFYRDEFALRTGIAAPPSARFVFKHASFPDLHGDYAAECLFRVSKADYAWLARAAAIPADGEKRSEYGLYRSQAEAAYGGVLRAVVRGQIRARAGDQHGGWALLDDGKTVHFWFVQT
ncbi:hypothetical protein DB354_16830 [Opitutus sp. ER46]|nr:hypothetical protein DB354_16830 [Opitutus sp. ER46]